MLTINNTLDGYLKDVEIKGNTIQDSENLADIRSVGDKVEGQELYEIPVLSCGENLFDLSKLSGGEFTTLNGKNVYKYIDNASFYFYNGKFKKDTQYTITMTMFRDVGYEVKGLNLEIVYTDGTSKNFSLTHGVIRTITSEKGKTIEKLSGSYNHGLTAYIDLDSICLNEGDVAINYQPYVEDKLTILSPVQLEKVGDVADRIIEKDGVCGAEKNVYNEVFTIDDISAVTFLDNVARYVFRPRTGLVLNRNAISNYTSNFYIDFAYDGESWYETGGTVVVKRNKATVGDTEEKAKEYLKNNPIVFLNTTTQPQFIPLPHDQQVKLRTFANKTNISFLTEIEGTIKAQVPKSIGATVNTHTEQINNLNKELDRVKKLEESTVSTVTTESDFATVEATSNGYFEDVKIEGKTLVNLNKKEINAMVNSVHNIIENNGVTRSYVADVEIGQTYTIIKDVATDRFDIGFASQYTSGTPTTSIVGIDTKLTVAKVVATDVVLVAYVDNTSTSRKVLILEGDHTQNPPAYFEGLKSVGQSATTSEDGVDEIVVSSVKGDGNLFDVQAIYNTQEVQSPYKWYVFKGKPNTNYTISSSLDKSARVNMFLKITDYNYTQTLAWLCHTNIANVSDYKTFTTDSQGRVGIAFSNVSDVSMFTTLSSFSIYEGNAIKPYTPHQSDKKRLLYYNEETQTWEKPVLREWDSIEKHANGKYYYHQRSGVKVLNGSENISCNDTYAGDKENTCIFRYFVSTIKKSGGMISDRFNNIGHIWGLDEEGIYPVETSVDIRISKTKLGITSDDDNNSKITKFKQWLQANNVTVVYQLAQEKVYECTNIDLITYANETNYIVECGAISPKTTLKVHNNISNVVSLLQKKVSLLENNITSYMITQNRLMLASRYNADTVSFKVDVATLRNSFEYDNDLYELILNNILVGKDNYNREYIENLIIFYWMDFVISDEMYSTLFEIIEEQHNPKIEEETPLI